jgi:hypothetical protein
VLLCHDGLLPRTCNLSSSECHTVHLCCTQDHYGDVNWLDRGVDQDADWDARLSIDIYRPMSNDRKLQIQGWQAEHCAASTPHFVIDRKKVLCISTADVFFASLTLTAAASTDLHCFLFSERFCKVLQP